MSGCVPIDADARDPSRRSRPRRRWRSHHGSRRTSRCGRLEPEDRRPGWPLRARLRSQPCRRPRSPRCDRPRDQCRRRRRRRGSASPTRSSGSANDMLSRASARSVSITSESHEPAWASPSRPSRITRTPTPRLSATVSDSTSPSWARISVRTDEPAQTSTCSPASSSTHELSGKAPGFGDLPHPRPTW